jgi:hypothetical protein
VRIHFGIEGSAERGTAYLIGMIIEDSVSERRFSFWADGEDQQEQILGGFLDVVESYPAGPLFGYGSFEVAFLKRMRKPGWAERIDRVLARTTNILPIIYSSVSFPVYSNGLKAVGAHLGCRWSEPEASGLQCIVWRTRWEQSRDEDLKRTIETGRRARTKPQLTTKEWERGDGVAGATAPGPVGMRAGLALVGPRSWRRLRRRPCSAPARAVRGRRAPGQRGGNGPGSDGGSPWA